MPPICNDTSIIAVVIPCFKTKGYILHVLEAIGPEITTIYVIDDKCPEQTGVHVQRQCNDFRIKVIFNDENMGVGGAVLAGYRQALLDGAEIIIKIDGDNQMNPTLIHHFIEPIMRGHTDYTKGNRFYTMESLSTMPFIRICGNSILSLLNKIVSGYWNVMDPTNGYTAIHSKVLALLPLDKISKGFFFESDMLFRLNTIRAVVKDIPIPAQYNNEISNLRIRNALLGFPIKLFNNFLKRIFYTYFLRDFNAGTILLCFGLLIPFFGVSYGMGCWLQSFFTHIPSTSGTVMAAALHIIIGSQQLISCINYDMQSVPRDPINKNQ